MLDKYGTETLHGTERCAMYHHRTMFLVVLARVFQFETFGQVVVHLYRTQLPTASEGIFHHEVELRTVECSFAIFYFGIQAFLLASFDDGIFSFFPNLVRTDILLTVVRVAQRNLRLECIEIQCTENNLDNLHHADELIFHLIRTTEDMGVVLRKRTYTCQSVQLSALFITVHRSEFGDSQGQVFI